MHKLQETELRENFVHVYGRDKETEKREGGLSPISPQNLLNLLTSPQSLHQCKDLDLVRINTSFGDKQQEVFCQGFSG